MNERIIGFPPIIGHYPRILILGTMPSIASLHAKEYYGNRMNAFWKILSAIKGIDCPRVYKDKEQLVRDLGLALWDVCHTCTRPGSADSNIHDEEPNPIAELLAENPSIRTIIFNGQTAEILFRRHLKKFEGVTTVTLPSTSPAYAKLTLAQKIEAWSEVIRVK